MTALLVVAIALITIDFKDGGNSGAHSAGGRLFAPVENLAGDVTGLFRGSSGGSQEIADLQQQNDQLRAELAQAQVGEADTAQLAKLLNLASAGNDKVVTGTVIAAGGDYSDTVTINAGSADGISRNETVLNGDGLVGTVVATTSSTATVQLATDAASTVGVRLAGSGQIGALSGTSESLSGGAQLKLRLFDSNAVLKRGQVLVTFGSVGGRPYVAGVPVGTISAVTTPPGSLTPTATVKPYADFTGLGVVGVVVST